MSVDMAGLIDHTLLTFPLTFPPLRHPDDFSASQQQREQAVRILCREAVAYGFKAVCVRPEYIRLAKETLCGTGVLVATVIGFPLRKTLLVDELAQPTIGQIAASEKLLEIRNALAQGCDEFDVVVNVSAYKQAIMGSDLNRFNELDALVSACQGRLVKVIIETDLLSEPQIKAITRDCALISEQRQTPMMVKTSTGMIDGGLGATVGIITVIRQALTAYYQEYPHHGRQCGQVGIKASGGIKTLAQVEALLVLGINRVGTSAGIALLTASITK